MRKRETHCKGDVLGRGRRDVIIKRRRGMLVDRIYIGNIIDINIYSYYNNYSIYNHRNSLLVYFHLYTTIIISHIIILYIPS